MQSGGSAGGSDSGSAGEGAGTGAGRRGDLLGRPLPRGSWKEPAERLDELYRQAEERAARTARWYLADRSRKRRAARLLRAGAALGVAAGVTLPLVELAGAGAGTARWGYLALLGAALCLGCDRWFGCTAGWMRDVATAQAVQRRLEALQYEWAAESVREALGPAEGTACSAAERRLALLRRFHEDLSELVRAETTEWMVEFRSGPGPLLAQTRRAPGAGESGCQAPRGRYGGQPQLSRPTMPRQRPPEGSF